MDTKTMVVAVILVIFAFLALIMATQGPYALGASMMSIIYLLIAFGVIGLIAYVIIYLFFTYRSPAYPALVKKDIADAAKMSRNPYVDTLEIGGDTSYQGHELGKVIGTLKLYYNVTNDENWLRQRFSQTYQETQELVKKSQSEEQTPVGEKAQQKVPLPKDILGIQDTVFIFRKPGILGLFSAPIYLRAIGDAWEYIKTKNGKDFEKDEDGKVKTKPRRDMIQHSDLSGTVRLWCNSIVKIGDYWYPNTSRSSLIPMQTQLADVDVKFGFTMLGVLGEVTDKATDINSTYKVMMDQKKLLEPAKPAPTSVT